MKWAAGSEEPLFHGGANSIGSVKGFYLALARLGGPMNRKGDGDPGWLVRRRGWMKLQSMLDGAEAERRRRKICRET